jgi:F-type H+-transporting ATPase subunit delta
MKKTAAKIYAKALIDIGQDEKKYKEVGNELRSMASVFSANPELKRFALNPFYSFEDMHSLIKSVGDALEFSTTVKRFLAILTNTRDIGIIEEISAAYSILEDDLSGKIKATVESASELDNRHIQEINKKLQQLTGKEIVLTVEKKPALIGGLVFRIGNTILDGSVKTQLERVKEKIIRLP